MCSFSQRDFDLNTVGHNGPTVKGVIAVCVQRSALWDFDEEKRSQWKLENKNGCFFMGLVTFLLCFP